MRAKDNSGVQVTDDEVDALLRAHGEIDYTHTPDGLDDAIHARNSAMITMDDHSQKKPST